MAQKNTPTAMPGMKHGAWCHIEIPTKDAEAAKRFYSGVFGWSFTHIPEMNYNLYSAGDGEIGGGLFDPPPGTPRHITNYINVDDLDAAAAKVAEFGGHVTTDRMEVPNIGWFRIIQDPDGNVFSLWQSMNRPMPAPAEKAPPKRAAGKKPAKKAARKKGKRR